MFIVYRVTLFTKVCKNQFKKNPASNCLPRAARVKVWAIYLSRVLHTSKDLDIDETF